MFRNIAFVTLLGAAVAAGPAGPAGLADPPERWSIRVAGGPEVLAVGAVDRRDGLVLYRTPSGVLSSIPEARVTAVEPALPAEAPSSSDRDDRAPRADPDVVTYTNDDLPTEPLPWQANFARASGALFEAPGVDAEAPLTYDTYLDRDGHDEGWWRARAAAIEAERGDAREQTELWTRRYRSLSDLVAIECAGRRFARYLPAVCADYVRLQRDAAARAADARAWLDEVEAERRNLSDDARRAGALPGWLR